MAIKNHARRFRRHYNKKITIEKYQAGSTGPRGGRQYGDPIPKDALVHWFYHLVKTPSGDDKVSTVTVYIPGDPQEYGPNDRITLPNGRVHNVILVRGVSGSGLVTLEA